jgi:hypothetical protein
MPNSSATPMPIKDRSSDIRIYLLNVTLVLNAPQQSSWQRTGAHGQLSNMHYEPRASRLKDSYHAKARIERFAAQ